MTTTNAPEQIAQAARLRAWWSDHGWFALALSLAHLAMGALIVSAPFTPTNDGPQHVLGSYARSHLHDPALGFDRFVVDNHPISGIGFTAIFDLLSTFCSWQLAHQLTLFVITSLYALAATALCAALGRRWLGLLFVPLAFQWHFYMGLLSFLVATSLSLALLAVLLRRRPSGVISWTMLAVALFVIATAHFMAAILGGVAVAVVLIASSTREARATTILATALAGTPALGVAVLVKLAGAGVAGATVFEPFGDRFASAVARFIGGPTWLAAPAVALAFAGAASALARRDERVLGGVALGAWSLALLLPTTLFGWELASSRPLILAGTLGIALLPVEKLARPARTVVIVALVAFGGVRFFHTASVHQKLSNDFAELWRGLDVPLASPGYRLPLLFEDDAPDDMLGWSPLRNFGSLFSTAQGGMNAYAFNGLANNHFILLRPEVKQRLPSAPERGWWLSDLEHASVDERADVVERMTRWGRLFDGVIVWGRPGDLDHLVARGYRVDHRDGHLLLASFTGCSATLSVRLDKPTPLAIDTGWWPADETADLHFADDIEAGESEVQLDAMGCGPAWIHVEALDPTDSLHCAEAQNGFVLVDTVKAPRATCTLVR